MGMLVFSKKKKHPNEFPIISGFYVVRSRELGNECEELLTREHSVDFMTISSHYHHHNFVVPSC